PTSSLRLTFPSHTIVMVRAGGPSTSSSRSKASRRGCSACADHDNWESGRERRQARQSGFVRLVVQSLGPRQGDARTGGKAPYDVFFWCFSRFEAYIA